MFAIFTLVGGVLELGEQCRTIERDRSGHAERARSHEHRQPHVAGYGKNRSRSLHAQLEEHGNDPRLPTVSDILSASASISSRSTRRRCGSKGRKEPCWRSSIFARSAIAAFAIRCRRSGRACLVSRRVTADRRRASISKQAGPQQIGWRLRSNGGCPRGGNDHRQQVARRSGEAHQLRKLRDRLSLIGIARRPCRLPFLLPGIVGECPIAAGPCGDSQCLLWAFFVFEGRQVASWIVSQNPAKGGRRSRWPDQRRRCEPRDRARRAYKWVLAFVIIGDRGLNRLAKPAGDQCGLLGSVEIRPQPVACFEHLSEAAERHCRHHAHQHQRNQHLDEREARLAETAPRGPRGRGPHRA